VARENTTLGDPMTENQASLKDYLMTIKALIEANHRTQTTAMCESPRLLEIARSIFRLDKEKQPRLVEFLGLKQAAFVSFLLPDYSG
jgi:hypothetical protein